MTNDAFGTDSKGPILMLTNSCANAFQIISISIREAVNGNTGSVQKVAFVRDTPQPVKSFFATTGNIDCDTAQVYETDAKNPTILCRSIKVQTGDSIGFNFHYDDLFLIRGMVGKNEVTIEGRLTDRAGFYKNLKKNKTSNPPEEMKKNGPQ